MAVGCQYVLGAAILLHMLAEMPSLLGSSACHVRSMPCNDVKQLSESLANQLAREMTYMKCFLSLITRGVSPASFARSCESSPLGCILEVDSSSSASTSKGTGPAVVPLQPSSCMYVAADASRLQCCMVAERHARVAATLSRRRTRSSVWPRLTVEQQIRIPSVGGWADLQVFLPCFCSHCLWRCTLVVSSLSGWWTPGPELGR